MQKSSIRLVPASECQRVWGSVITITNQIQCVGGEGTVSVCSVSGFLYYQQTNNNLLFIYSMYPMLDVSRQSAAPTRNMIDHV